MPATLPAVKLSKDLTTQRYGIGCVEHLPRGPAFDVTSRQNPEVTVNVFFSYSAAKLYAGRSA
ncbi:hypothetical protein KY362_06905 [Candidatus Woesearchaeota archaeon]|nr:hypothetical protein [Candidatus Woesearchaeota archaeon]